ncbi:MAG: phosphatidylglycerol lysyltransferase domain-containing protein [Promethearchaeia archaeon]
MDFANEKQLEIADMALFEQYFDSYPPQISEFTFTNLFIWRFNYELLFTEWKNHLLVFSKTYLKSDSENDAEQNTPYFFFPPIGENPSQLIIKLFRELKNLEFHRVPKTLINSLKAQFQDDMDNLGLKIHEDRDNWDYVYKRESLVNLEGNKYRNKRRYLETFKEQYDYEFHLISEEWLDDCRKLQDKWCDIKNCQKNEDIHQEHIAVQEAFDNYEELGYNGGLILVDGKPAGYTIGERLNEDTVVIHIEKAHTYYEGSYQAINNLFAKKCCDNIKFVNREQDLGIPGLRKSKKSYHPHHMIKKYIIEVSPP